MRLFFNKNDIINGSRACGLSIWIKSHNELIMHSIIIEKKGNNLSISSKESINSFDQLKLKVTKSTPIYLAIDGKGVLHKIIESRPDTLPISEILPNADSKDFIIQEVELTNSKRIVSISRRDRIEEIVTLIAEQGFDILKLILGPFSIVNILKYTNESLTIEIPSYKIYLYDGLINRFDRVQDEALEFSINVDSSIIDSKYIIPFANSLNHFAVNQSITIDYQNIDHHTKNFHYKRLFQQFGWGLLIVLFMSLLLNYLVFENYRTKNQLITSQIGNNKEILIRIKKLKLQVKTKEDFYKSNLSFINPLKAYYLDRIAKDVPLSITLNKLCMAPLQNQAPGKEKIQFQQGKILLSGYTSGSSCLDSWIKSLKSLGWINEIIIRNYNDNNVETAKFDLEISFRE